MAKDEAEIQIVKINEGKIRFYVLGTSPIILNRMSQKARHELAAPKGRKTTADKSSNAKHFPLTEYQESPYTNPDPEGKTFLQLLSSMFKKSMMCAALDLPGTKKAQIGRLLYVKGDRIDLYGIPKLFMSVTRSADMNKTPDIRTRAIIPQWATMIDVNFIRPILNEQSVVNLMAAAGITSGMGDWRPEKGSGNYGQFMIVQADDKEFNEILKTGGRKAQQEAMQNPTFYDEESRELFEYVETENKRKGFKAV
jgi:hypothetical protein